MEIESYTLIELSEKENKARQTIKNSDRYIWVKVYSERMRRRMEKWYQKKDYTVKYIRLEDIKKALKGKVEFTFIQ